MLIAVLSANTRGWGPSSLTSGLGARHSSSTTSSGLPDSGPRPTTLPAIYEYSTALRSGCQVHPHCVLFPSGGRLALV